MCRDRTLTGIFGILLLGLIISSGCYSIPQIDLDHPICFVRDFRDSPPGWTAKQEQDLTVSILRGSWMWFKHLPDAGIPPVVITNEESKCGFNPPIKIKVIQRLDDACANNKWAWNTDGFVITLTTDCGISPLVIAHEFGHAIWSFDHVDEHGLLNLRSVMTPTANFYVTPLDMKNLCSVHPEILCPEFKWCEGTFYDEFRCPSESPETGDMMYMHNATLNKEVIVRERIRKGLKGAWVD